MGTRNRLSSSLPPPSPIPTGKGSRSAVDSALSEYIDQTQIVPELSLPQRWVPAEIDYRSLKFRDNQAIEKISKSISDHGVFLVTDHGGFSTGELRSILIDNQWIFALLSPDHDDRRRRYNEKYVWSISNNKLMVEKGKYAADKEEIFQILSQEMENIATKLKEIALELNQVVLGSASGQPATETKLCIYRSIYNIQESSIIEQSDGQELSQHPSKYDFNLFLPLQPAEFYVQAKQLSFRTTTQDTVIVAIGKELEIMNSLIVKPNLHGNSVSLSIELNYSFPSPSSSSTSHDSDVDVAQNKISLRDQIVIVIVFILLYKFFYYIIS